MKLWMFLKLNMEIIYLAIDKSTMDTLLCINISFLVIIKYFIKSKYIY